MKMRKRRKVLLAKVKNNRPFEYYMKQLALKIQQATAKMSQALQKAYTNAA
jgi:hypothetical protein